MNVTYKFTLILLFVLTQSVFSYANDEEEFRGVSLSFSTNKVTAGYGKETHTKEGGVIDKLGTYFFVRSQELKNRPGIRYTVNQVQGDIYEVADIETQTYAVGFRGELVYDLARNFVWGVGVESELAYVNTPEASDIVPLGGIDVFVGANLKIGDLLTRATVGCGTSGALANNGVDDYVDLETADCRVEFKGLFKK